MKKETTLEEVLGSSMCQFSVIENKLSILYRNQVKIYDAVTKEQQGYSEEEVLEIIRQYALEEHLITSSKPSEWFEQFKNK